MEFPIFSWAQQIRVHPRLIRDSGSTRTASWKAAISSFSKLNLTGLGSAAGSLLGNTFSRLEISLVLIFRFIAEHLSGLIALAFYYHQYSTNYSS